MSPFVTALVQLCEEENSSETVENIRNLALTKMASGEVKSLVVSSINGKSFNFNISKSADVLFSECSQAIRAFNEGSVTAMEIDFSMI